MRLMADRPVRVVGSHFLHDSLKGGICFRPLVEDAGREIIGVQHRERVIRINSALFVAVYEGQSIMCMRRIRILKRMSKT